MTLSVPYRGFGDRFIIKGKAGSFPSRDKVPEALLAHWLGLPIPATVGGSNNVTFTLKGSTRPIPLWIGNDFALLDEDLTYTWGAVSNPILDSTGAAATDTDSVLGVWYMYCGIDVTADVPTLVLRPSQTAPEATDSRFGGAWLSHPGTDKANFWRYVGFMVCTTAATPAFLTQVKIGWEWHWAALAASPVTAALTVTSVFSVRVPKLAKYGGRVAGNLVTGKAGTVTVGGSSVASQGVAIAKHSGTASGIITAPFDIPGPNDATGELYAIAVVSAGASISVTRYRDVV